MKRNKKISIFTSLIIVLFILSIFSGTVSAQTTGEKANDQYQINKDKYENTKKEFNEAKKNFEDANKRFKSARDNKSGNRSDELIQNAKEYILKAIDHAQAQLQVMKNRLETRENGGMAATDFLNIIGAHTAELEQLKEKVNQTTTIQEIKDAHKELTGIVIKINLENRYFMGISLNRRIDTFITKAINVSAEADSFVEKLQAEGKDVTGLKAKADDFNKELNEAKDIHAKTIALYATHPGFASDGNVINENDARNFLKESNDLQRDTIKNLKDAGKKLVDFGKELKRLKKVSADKNSDLEVTGGATATATGQ